MGTLVDQANQAWRRYIGQALDGLDIPEDLLGVIRDAFGSGFYAGVEQSDADHRAVRLSTEVKANER